MAIETHYDGVDVAGTVEAAKERAGWTADTTVTEEGYAVTRSVKGQRKVVGGFYKSDDARFVEQAAPTILALAARLEAAERERDEAREATRWRQLKDEIPPIKIVEDGGTWGLTEGDVQWVAFWRDGLNALNKPRLTMMFSRNGTNYWLLPGMDNCPYDEDWWYPVGFPTLPQPPQGGA